ncbi:FAD-dependent oxidoreductase [Amycolatopsis rhabdoformis]|uniref:FAD-dependent oxidoreductase n=1 Tax=Amycolatopsis rhabdoformis TaxID=1448059 RepID=A0ABZ1HXN0_9PSEU|nr:FAD-dependent oxidoreductase [Amycolatopsis rhabdoformis]WSE26312.1 FAD-dependent oxidoreductase [Amycolatopsis rhabdoformis]
MRIVIAGGGLAGVSVCRELRARGFGGEVVLLDREAGLPYDRPPLSKQLLKGTAEPEDILLPDAARLAEYEVDHRAGVTVSGLGDRVVALADGAEVPFDGLVIATGAAARRVPGQPDVAGIHPLRTLADALALRGHLATARDLVVIGGGFIGLEVAAAAVGQGVATTVVERDEVPLAHAIGPVAGGWMTDLHRDHGVRFACGTEVSGFTVTDGRVRGVDLADGEHLPADVVVVGVGAAPVTGWLGDAVPVADGVVCDAGLRAAPRIYAAGDVARWQHPRFGSIRAEHWTTAVDHARTVATNLLAELETGVPGGKEAAEVPYFWTDQYDTKLQLAGWAGGHDRREVVEDGRALLYGRGNRLVAALALNRPAFVARHRRAIAAGVSWREATEAVRRSR